jgi:hypothetical protein
VSPVSPHPSWCARGHRCRLGEHRAAPVTLAGSGPAGTVRAIAVLTRLLSTNGRQQVEVRLRIALPYGEDAARRRLVLVLAELQALLDRIGRLTRSARAITRV